MEILYEFKKKRSKMKNIVRTHGDCEIAVN